MANNTSEIMLPFDGQEFIDAFRTLWRYDSSIQAWRRVGPVENVPVASDVAAGLLSSVFKQMLDKIPEKGGGFGIVVKPFLSMKSPTNPDGVITGKVNVISDSMDISCLGIDGKPLTAECGKLLPDNAPGSGEEVKRPSVTFKLSEEFLKTLCVELVSAPGPKGKQGKQGEPGKPGTGDGPQGDTGDSGKDATGSLKFAGIEIRDTDDVFDTAVTAIEVDQEGGKLAVTKSKVRAPADDTPATQAISTQIDRSIEFTSGFNYNILMAPNDPINKADVTMVGLPQGFEPDGSNKTTLNAVRLSTFLDLVISDYRARLAKIDEAYTKEIHDFIIDKDAKARDAINSLACQLSEAEWNLPIEYCLGVAPNDCKGTNEPKEFTFRLAGDLFGDQFCETSKAEDLGVYYVPAGAGQSRPLVEVKYPSSGGVSSTQLPTGGYLVVYEGGTLRDASRPDLGNFVGKPDLGYGLTVNFSGTGGGTKIIPDITSCDKTDPVSVEAAYRNADISKKSVHAVMTSSPKISLAAKVPAPYDNPSGVIAVHVYRVMVCDAGKVQFDKAAYDTDPQYSDIVQLQVVRKEGTIGTMTVDYATKDGTAIAGTDYTASTGTLSFGDGELVKIITVPIIKVEVGDGGLRTFTVELSNPQGGQLGTITTATVTVTYSEYA